MTTPLADEELRERVRSIILDVAPTKVGSGPDAPATDADPSALNLAADLGYHSLALLEAIVALEEELGVGMVDDGGAMFIKTVGDLEEYVLRITRDAAAESS